MHKYYNKFKIPSLQETFEKYDSRIASFDFI